MRFESKKNWLRVLPLSVCPFRSFRRSHFWFVKQHNQLTEVYGWYLTYSYYRNLFIQHLGRCNNFVFILTALKSWYTRAWTNVNVSIKCILGIAVSPDWNHFLNLKHLMGQVSIVFSNKQLQQWKKKWLNVVNDQEMGSFCKLLCQHYVWVMSLYHSLMFFSCCILLLSLVCACSLLFLPNCIAPLHILKSFGAICDWLID